MNTALFRRLSLALFVCCCVTACFGETDNGEARVTVGDKAENGAGAPVQAAVLDLYKAESCGCCSLWQQHMEAVGFTFRVHHPDDLNALKVQHGIAPAYQSCHTGVSDAGYVFEGHVPAKLVKAFLADPPANAKGLTVPGMPLGSPGMEVGDRFTPYDVLLINNDGTTAIYSHIETKDEQY